MKIKHGIKKCLKCERVIRTSLRWLLGGVITQDEAVHRIAHYHEGCNVAARYAENFAAETSKMTDIAYYSVRA